MAAPHQQLRVYRRFDWRDANLAALAERQCGEPQLRIEQGWQIRYLSCEEVVPAGKAVPASSYDFGYGMKQGRWEPLAGTRPRRVRIACRWRSRSSWVTASRSWIAASSTPKVAAPSWHGSTNRKTGSS